MKAEYKTIDDYIATFPLDVQEILQAVRATVQQAAPEATEAISYQMPTFKLEGNLVHFAAYKNHIGLYPTPQGVEAFREELSRYKGAKGSVQFPLDQPIPHDLIRKIVLFRVAATKDESGFPKSICNPARRALEHAGYPTLEGLAGVPEDTIAGLHGMGPKALGILREALDARGLSFSFPRGVPGPALRALQGAGYARLEQLDGVDEKALAELHGLEPKALEVLRVALTERGLAFGGGTDGAG